MQRVALVVSVGLLFTGGVARSAAGQVASFVVTPEAIAADRPVALDTVGWRYHPGDDAAWSRPDVDDAAWDLLATTAFTAGAMPRAGLPSIGWFRLHVRVEGGAIGRPVALALHHWGASEIYLDGRLLDAFGAVSASPSREQPFNPRGRPVAFTITDAHTHVLAIRYSFAATGDSRVPAKWLTSSDRLIGFHSELSEARAAVGAFERDVARETALSLGFGALFAAFGLLHLLLFVFYPRERGNLFFSGFAAALSAVMVLDWLRQLGHHGLWHEMLLTLALPTTGLLYCASFLAFLYATFLTRRPPLFRFYCAAWMVALALYVRDPASATADLLSVLLLVVFAAECLRVMVIAWSSRQQGAAVVAVGVMGSLVTPITVALQMSGVAMPLYTRNLASRLAFLAMILSASISLARRVASTNRTLEAKLVEVRELSARQLEQERREAELLLRQERERAEFQRRAKELEAARALQLSMLPQELPAVPSLDIAAYMRTATEVGGDYYDFSVHQDGTLTVVVGDATGHGLKAGTVVTAAKSLFTAYVAESDIARLFEDSSRVLSQMQMGSLFMALQVLKIQNGRMRIASAGMPSAAIYRARSGTVEEVTAGGPPLGIPIPWRYEEETYTLEPGDAVLLMTDGIPERFNAKDEMFGYDRARALLERADGTTASQIIERVVDAAETWADGRPQDDDVTVLVLKVRETRASAAGEAV